MQTYSVRKIPTVDVVIPNQEENNDKIKILELINAIDEWEKTVLFAQNGFFFLKGKNVENKTKEFLKELDDFISFQISQYHFVDSTSKLLVSEIKKNKLKSIEEQMINYEKSQLKSWEIEVYENSIKSCTQRAVLYKNVQDIVSVSFNQALEILDLMSKREKWSKKTYEAKKEIFESDFYFELINAFILDKDVKAAVYFKQYKDKILDEKKEQIENSIEVFKNNVIAFNWAKELFSYNLPDEKNQAEINEIKDKELKNLVKHYLSDFKLEEKRTKEVQQKEANENNWKEIISKLSSEPDRAELFIDYTLNDESIKAKKLYIKQMRADGYINTDKKEFLSLLEDCIENFEKFKQKDISNFHKSLSAEDYDLIEKIKKYTSQEYSFLVSDYAYISKQLEKSGIKEKEEIYDFIKFVFASKDNYVSNKKEEPDIETRNKLIKSAIERYSKK